MINIFCPGGLSHLDTFDYKPELVQIHDDRDVFQASPDELPAIDIHNRL
ncbi:MAG: hypothetical protein ACKOEX_12990 [Planctomycetia bacterium]